MRLETEAQLARRIGRKSRISSLRVQVASANPRNSEAFPGDRRSPKWRDRRADAAARANRSPFGKFPCQQGVLQGKRDLQANEESPLREIASMFQLLGR